MNRSSRRRPGSGLLLVALVALGACTPVGGGGGPEPEGPPVPTLAPGRLPAVAETQASGLLAVARAALEEERWDDAREAAARIVDEFPASRSSVDALVVLARAEAGAGDVEAATRHADRLARVLPPDDPRQTDAATIRARALDASGRPAEAVRVLLALPPELAPRGGAADDLVRAAARSLDRDALAGILRDAPLGSPLAVPVTLAYASRLRLAGDVEGARRYAGAALDAGAQGDDAQVARAILEGRALPGEAPGRLALVLPLSGSPLLQDAAGRIREGVEAALAASPLDGTLELQILDDRGDAQVAADLVREARQGGAQGVVGPLQDDALRSAAAAADGTLPVVSPTAYELPEGVGSVYSLASVDPGAPLALAEWATSVGLRQVVVLHPQNGPSAEEARVFNASFGELGGSVLRTLTYEPGATFFQDQMRAIQGLRPQALVLSIPPEDVQAIASQAAFYALDTLGIQILGTAAFGDPGVRSSVSARYTDGVVTATPRAAGGSPGYDAFVAAYESRFQRTLTETAFTAAGFDAASLLLRALESGARGAAVGRALEEVEGFQGATGTLSIRDGRVVRDHVVLCVQDGGLVELPPETRPWPVYRPYAPNPETGIVPEGPGRAAGFRCTPGDPAAPR